MQGADLEPSVALLADHAGFIDCLVRWYEQEWQPYYGERGPGDARADLQSRCNRGRLPIGFVDIQDDRILGTAALDHDATTGRTPSVVGLLVGPDHRRRGVANEMIGFAERLARDLGYDELFMSTGILGELVRRRGWQELGDVQFLHDERGKVYMCPLTLSRSP